MLSRMKRKLCFHPNLFNFRVLWGKSTGHVPSVWYFYLNSLAGSVEFAQMTYVCDIAVSSMKTKSVLTLSNLRKYGLHAERTTLCAVKLLLSQASVTSTKSSSSLKFRNVLRILEWKSFHLSEYCCSPLDDEEAAMASVPSGPTAEGTRGAIVLTLALHENTLSHFTSSPHPFTRFHVPLLPEDLERNLGSARRAIKRQTCKR